MAAAVAVASGGVFEGSIDGFLRAYDADSGKLLWEYDTAREVKGVNGISGHGGSVNGAGATVSGGLVFQTTGYAAYGLGMPGNVLLVFAVPDSAKTAEKTGN
jgi:polyvinyl alcohol dehydrogenase (cytochrome)